MVNLYIKNTFFEGVKTGICYNDVINIGIFDTLAPTPNVLTMAANVISIHLEY